MHTDLVTALGKLAGLGHSALARLLAASFPQFHSPTPGSLDLLKEEEKNTGPEHPPKEGQEKRNRRGRRKDTGDISNVAKEGTFLLWLD
ncbi:MAG TPA: hypothetical protein VM492_10210, partial [Sumerlaeia bacterium]|nr:hypothetical protein [Sumerlaeia bacterium]